MWCVLLPNHYQLLCFRCHGAAIRAYAHAVEVHTCLQCGAIVQRQVPVYGVGAAFAHTVLAVCPQVSSAHVKHVDGHIYVAAHAVVVHDEGGRGVCGVVCATDAEQVRLQPLHHRKCQFGG